MWQNNRFQGFGPSPYGMGTVTKRLLVATIAIFVIDWLLWPRPAMGLSALDRWMGLSRSGIFSGKIWQFFTYLFIHGGLMHLFSNMLGLYFFGNELEARLGRQRFLLLYFGAGLLGGLGWLILSSRSDAVCIGASGAVFGIIGAFAAIYPHRQITLLVFFILPVTLTARTLALIFGGVSLLLLRSNAGGIAHAAHLAGGVAGYIYGMRVAGTRAAFAGNTWSTGGWRRAWSNARAAWRRQRLSVHYTAPPDNTPVDWNEVDRILIKVKALGMGGLNRQERNVLEQASRQSR